jgi:hypothetical protein
VSDILTFVDKPQSRPDTICSRKPWPRASFPPSHRLSSRRTRVVSRFCERLWAPCTTLCSVNEVLVAHAAVFTPLAEKLLPQGPSPAWGSTATFDTCPNDCVGQLSKSSSHSGVATFP